MSPTGRWVTKAKVLRNCNRGHSQGGPCLKVFFVTVARGLLWLMQSLRRRNLATFLHKVPSGSSLACCRRIAVAATPYSSRAAANTRPLRITFWATSGRRQCRAQSSWCHTSRRGGNWVALICPATSSHRQAQADLEPVVSGCQAGGCKKGSVSFTPSLPRRTERGWPIRFSVLHP